MNFFNRRQIQAKTSGAEKLRMNKLLLAAGIGAQTRSAFLAKPGRRRGIPGTRSDCAYEYRIHVYRADYTRTERVLVNRS